MMNREGEAPAEPILWVRREPNPPNRTRIKILVVDYLVVNHAEFDVSGSGDFSRGFELRHD